MPSFEVRAIQRADLQRRPRAEPSHSSLRLLARASIIRSPHSHPRPRPALALTTPVRCAAISSPCVRTPAADLGPTPDTLSSRVGCPPTALSRSPTSCSTASLSWLRIASFTPSVSATRYFTRYVLRAAAPLPLSLSILSRSPGRTCSTTGGRAAGFPLVISLCSIIRGSGHSSSACLAACGLLAVAELADRDCGTDI